MPTKAIIERVRELKAELAKTEPHPSTAADFEAIEKQVDTVLLEPGYAPHYLSLRDKLLYAYDGFELRHPKLAGLFENVTTELAEVGI